MKLIPHYLRHLPNVLENPSIPLSSHNPQQRETHDPPKSITFDRIPKTLQGNHQLIANIARLNPLHPNL